MDREAEVVAVVGAALLRTGDDGVRRVLVSRRTDPPHLAGYWEFPGGKVDPGETDVEALVRELREELQLETAVEQRLGPDLPIGDTAVLRVYLARVLSDGEPALVDHDAHRWLAADELDDVAWIPVDLPLVELLRPLLTPSPRLPLPPVGPEASETDGTKGKSGEWAEGRRD